MKTLLLLALALSLATCVNWAVLVAGSRSYSNYRHQADVYHNYQVLVKGGFDRSKIITMAVDDIANNPSNPFKGKVYNKPSYKDPGVDVYEGVKIDYSGNEVTPENFLAVLEGNSTATKGKKVLEITPQDNVFVFFSDHGSVGLIAFPYTYLYADKLLASLAKINGKYNKFVFYLETCESGSMFEKLPTNSKIYALSASNPKESSWGTYCSPDDVVQGKHIGSCLGDLFSVSFIEDIEKGNANSQTLNEQFLIVKKLTNRSQVMQWGDLSFKEDLVGDFVTKGKRSLFNNLRFYNPLNFVGDKPRDYAAMNSRTMTLQSLSAIYARDRSPQVFLQMQQEMASMKRLDSTFKSLNEKLQLSGNYDTKEIRFECLRATVDSYEQKCGKLSDYGLQFVRSFAQACEHHSSEQIVREITC